MYKNRFQERESARKAGDYPRELKVSSQNGFSALNRTDVNWFPSMNMERAKAGYVFFENAREYWRARRILQLARCKEDV